MISVCQEAGMAALEEDIDIDAVELFFFSRLSLQ